MICLQYHDIFANENIAKKLAQVYAKLFLLAKKGEGRHLQLYRTIRCYLLHRRHQSGAISRYTAYRIEEETDKREGKGRRCCLGVIQFHAAL